MAGHCRHGGRFISGAVRVRLELVLQKEKRKKQREKKNYYLVLWRLLILDGDFSRCIDVAFTLHLRK